MNTVPQKEKQFFTLPISKHTDTFENINVNRAHDQLLTFGNRLANSIANGIGHWNFILIQSCIMMLWFLFNSIAYFSHFDPYPFVFLNLAMSMEAAFSAPIILMSQNRQTANVKAGQDLLAILKHLDQQDRELERKFIMVLSAIDKSKGTTP